MTGAISSTAAVSGYIAWRCIPTAKPDINTRKLPSRREFFSHHLHRIGWPTNNVCIVCRDACNSPVRIKLCGHITCEGCLRDWFSPRRGNKRCPQCQVEVLYAETDISEAILSIIFTAGVMSFVMALVFSVSRSILYLIVMIAHFVLVRECGTGMLFYGGKWWQEMTHGAMIDLVTGTVFLVGPWCLVAFLFSLFWL